LSEATGATYWLGEAARPLVTYDFTGMHDGDELRVGKVSIRVIATPGHTPDSVCLLVTDQARSAEPWFLLTGDTLFVGDVGRPDLLVGDRRLDVYDAKERAGLLFQSLKERLLTLPDHVEIYPGHFGGSACGGVNMSGKAASTIAFERRFNLALQHDDAESFGQFVVAGLKPLPKNYAQIKRQNLGLKEDA
jgi:hydroxyacylglutathione hydrolase